jgi:hypothetical protein
MGKNKETNKMKKKPRFEIDFFEFSFLVEACIPPRPIARAMFWQKAIDVYYYELTKDERARLYEWINRCYSMEHGIKEGNEDCWLFNARYNPDNQYLVEAKNNDKTETYHCFHLNGRYYTKSNTSIVEEYITNVTKL